MFLLRVKLIASGEKRETSTKTCNETMLRDKLRVFVSRISPPLALVASVSEELVAMVSLSWWSSAPFRENGLSNELV